MENLNPYKPPDTAGPDSPIKSQNNATGRNIYAAFSAGLGFVLNSAWGAYWLEQSIFSFLGIFTIAAIMLAVAGAYLLIRSCGAWGSLAVFGVIAILLTLVRNSNYASAVKLIAVQSLSQMTLVITFILMLKPMLKPDSSRK